MAVGNTIATHTQRSNFAIRIGEATEEVVANLAFDLRSTLEHENVIQLRGSADLRRWCRSFEGCENGGPSFSDVLSKGDACRVDWAKCEDPPGDKARNESDLSVSGKSLHPGPKRAGIGSVLWLHGALISAWLGFWENWAHMAGRKSQQA